MPQQLKRILFVLFFLSGFCCLLYQVIWIRMAYASFGTITPVLSVIISVFMLGLSIGSYWGGRLIDNLVRHWDLSPIQFYAFVEFFIGIGAFTVPEIFSLGERWLLSAGEMNSIRYLMLSDIIIILSVLPWCILMGATYPFMMSFIKRLDRESSAGFSYLYCANVLGAMCGTLITAWILIELTGFYHALVIAAAFNFLIFFTSLVVNKFYPYKNTITAKTEPVNNKQISEKENVIKPAFIFSLLFFTGFTSMAMEVIWIRAFTPILLNTIYSFASLLTMYFLATLTGASLYRMHLKRSRIISTENLLAGLAVVSFLPILVNDPRLIISVPIALISIFPLCAGLGYLTPKLIDAYSMGYPYEAGKAYAGNIAGCVIGPVFASYVLLPVLGVKFSLIILSVPFLLFFISYFQKEIFPRIRFSVITVSVFFLIIVSAWINMSYEDVYISPETGVNDRTYYILPNNSVVRRDHTATVISTGQGMSKMLLINGIGTTSLTPVTKMMAHLPLAFCRKKPQSALVICLGMGTTYRSALSWNIKTTAVELVPSVKKAFGYYFPDAEKILNHPDGRIIIDDGRRFLKRTTETFDMITIDPPPPLESAGSSLLHSEEFYDLIKTHLKTNGIFQQWFPCGELKIAQAIARSLSNTFPYVRVYQSVEGWGLHFLASINPIDIPSPQIMLSRIPEKARQDITEWYQVDHGNDLEGFIRFILKGEIPVAELLNDDKRITITDNKPFNEYFFLRRITDNIRGRYKEISCVPSPNNEYETF